ncbi:MAG: hypothetical protein LBQ90_02395 [Synergistaceae bacterium]|nr:hypothetical protein [Synergistaceae bacterium]
MRRLLGALLLLCVWSSLLAGPVDAAVNAKKRKYNKNALPVGWRYEAGYTLWRMQRGLASNPASYRKYRRDSAWIRSHRRGFQPGATVIDGLDWTEKEIAEFWERYNEYFRFHPAGVERE